MLIARSRWWAASASSARGRRYRVPSRRCIGDDHQPPGATPERIETEVTDRIEAAVNTVAGIESCARPRPKAIARHNTSTGQTRRRGAGRRPSRPGLPTCHNRRSPVGNAGPDSQPISCSRLGSRCGGQLTTYTTNVQKRLESVNGVGECPLRRRRREIQIRSSRYARAVALSTNAWRRRAGRNLELRRQVKEGARDLRAHRAAAHGRRLNG